ncbi:MAG: acyl-CoA thioester hydrolase/BAAT C-terminal domain-containing protein [Paenalcaligenes sp.]
MYRSSSTGAGKWQQWLLGSMLMCTGSIAVAQTAATLPRADGSAITYYVKQAESQPAEQLLVIMQGSDCNSVQNNPRIQEVFVPMLPDADVLTVDKYGIDASLAWSSEVSRSDCPVAMLFNDSLHQRVQDYRAVLQAVKKKGDYKQVIVVGGSEGAVTAIMLAAQSEAVDATIAFNGGGRWFKDDMLYSMTVGVPPEDISPDIAKSVDDLFVFLDQAPTEEAAIGDHGVRWWKAMKEHDQQATLMKVRSPVLVMQGGKDESVSPVAVEQMMGEVQAAGRSNVHYKPYPELNHVFEDAEGQSHLDTVIGDMKVWLLEAAPPQP